VLGLRTIERKRPAGALQGAGEEPSPLCRVVITDTNPTKISAQKDLLIHSKGRWGSAKVHLTLMRKVGVRPGNKALKVGG